TPGGNQTTSPGRTSSLGPPSTCTQPQPIVMISVWPSGCVCQAVRAPGSNVTKPPPARAGSVPRNGVSTRTDPVKCSAGPFRDGCELLRVIFIVSFFSPCAATGLTAAANAATPPLAASMRRRVIIRKIFASLLENFSRDAHRTDRVRPAGVERQMRDGLDDLLFRDAVLTRPCHVRSKLVGTV